RFPDALSFDSPALVSPPVFQIFCAAVPFTITVLLLSANPPASDLYPLSLHDALPIFIASVPLVIVRSPGTVRAAAGIDTVPAPSATEKTSDLPSPTPAPAHHPLPTTAVAAYTSAAVLP